MDELQFELLVLRFSFYIKQITEVVACCHRAHDNPEVLRVTHAPMQKEMMCGILIIQDTMPNTFSFTTMHRTLN